MYIYYYKKIDIASEITYSNFNFKAIKYLPTKICDFT